MDAQWLRGALTCSESVGATRSIGQLGITRARVIASIHEYLSRGVSAAPFHHVVHLGPPQFLGFGFTMNSLEDLQILAKQEGAVTGVENIPDPIGGGQRVVLMDPDNFSVEAVFGQTAEAIPSRMGRTLVNSSGVYDRQGVDAKTGGNILQNVGNRELGGRKALS